MNEFQYQVSVIVPVYNVEEYLSACLDWLLTTVQQITAFPYAKSMQNATPTLRYLQSQMKAFLPHETMRSAGRPANTSCILILMILLRIQPLSR